MSSTLGRIAVLGGAAVAAGVLAKGMRQRPALAGSPSLQSPNPVPDPPVEERSDGRPRWKPRWTIPARSWKAGSLSPDGRTLAWVDSLGRLTWVDTSTGKEFSRGPAIRGAERLLVDNRGVVVAWAGLNPGRTGVWILRPVDAPPVRRDLGAALWSAVLDPRGTGVWVGTGDSRLHWVPLDGGTVQSSQVPGIADGLVATPSGVVASLWLESGICAVDPTGNVRWRLKSDDRARRWRPMASGDGRIVLALSSTGPQRRDWRVERLDPVAGTQQWAKPLSGTVAEAMLAQDGGRLAIVAVSAAGAGRDGGQRKLHMLDDQGNWLFHDKGSAVFEPRLAAISVRGERITVLDGERGIMSLDRSGRTIARRIGLPGAKEGGKPAPVESVLATADGRRMVLVRGDGRITGYESVA